jgi:hypothetical protein
LPELYNSDKLYRESVADMLRRRRNSTKMTGGSVRVVYES